MQIIFGVISHRRDDLGISTVLYRSSVELCQIYGYNTTSGKHERLPTPLRCSIKSSTYTYICPRCSYKQSLFALLSLVTRLYSTTTGFLSYAHTAATRRISLSHCIPQLVCVCWFGMHVNRKARTAVFVSSSMFVLLTLYCLFWEHKRNVLYPSIE